MNTLLIIKATSESIAKMAKDFIEKRLIKSVIISLLIISSVNCN